jgi:hypothetical protein
MPDTPLGSIVSIRAEKDRKVIKGFSPEQRRIYNEWRNRNAQKKLDNPDKLSKDFTALENTLKQLFQ